MTKLVLFCVKYLIYSRYIETQAWRVFLSVSYFDPYTTTGRLMQRTVITPSKNLTVPLLSKAPGTVLCCIESGTKQIMSQMLIQN